MPEVTPPQPVLDPQRHAQIKSLFGEVCDLPEAERLGRLQSLSNDPDLIAEVLTLVRTSGPSTTVLARPIAGFFADAGELAPGDTLGPWRLVEPLGSGGMGQVFLAERCDGLYQQQVAIKLLRGLPTPDALSRLAAERTLLAGLTHPNIARLYDGGTTPAGRPYLVMERVLGQPIDVWCQERKLKVEAILQLLAPVCAAVAFAHQHLIVHCDLKPSNVLVAADGRPVLLDFGIARLLGGSEDPSGQAQAAAGFTPRYASPEQRDGRPVSTATDVYGLGRLLEELLSQAGAPIPEDLRAVLARTTADDPQQRYPSVAAFSADLDRYQRHYPVSAVPAGVVCQLHKLLRRRWPIVVPVAVSIVLILVSGVRLLIERDRADRRFNQVRKLAHKVVFDYHDALAKLEGGTELRKSLLTDGLAYLDALAADAGNDRRLQAEAAEAYFRLAKIQADFRDTRPGELKAARQHLGRALDLQRKLAEAAPGDADTLKSLAEMLAESAQLDADTGAPDAALAALNQAVAAGERAYRLRAKFRGVFADALAERAQLQGLQFGRHAAAGQDLRQEKQLRQEQLAGTSLQAERAWIEAGLLHRAARLDAAQGRTQPALAALQQAADTLGLVPSRQQERRPLRPLLIDILVQRAQLQRQTGDLDGAGTTVEYAGRVLVAHTADEPRTADVRRLEVAIGLEQVALHLARDDLRVALIAAEQLSVKGKGLGRNVPESLLAQTLAGETEATLAAVHAALGNTADARKHYAAAAARMVPFAVGDTRAAARRALWEAGGGVK